MVGVEIVEKKDERTNVDLSIENSLYMTSPELSSEVPRVHLGQIIKRQGFSNLAR
jgi:hypothetical protein